MKRYLFFSGGTHVLFLALWLTTGALLSKPRMSYYAVDLASSLPAGSPSISGASAAPAPEVAAPKEIPAPVAPVHERRLPAKEVIKVQGKPKKQPRAAPKPQKKQGLNLKAALAVLGEGQGKTGAGTGANNATPGGGGSGIMTDSGPAFPYPWSLKAIADKLNRAWHPPQDFQEDTLCQVAFVIHKDGQISDVHVEKASGDSTFDQLAQRAVMYSNPLQELPAGFPDDTLRVHMKFMGKPL